MQNKPILYHLDIHPNQADAVVLLHGLGANSSSWKLQVPAFEKEGYRLVIPDLRGFGKSLYPGHTSLPEMANDVRELMDYLNIQRTHIVGISLGGTVALQFALDAPEKVNKLVLVNTFAKLRPKHPGVWAYMLWRLILVHTIGMKTQAQVVARRVFPHPSQESFRQELMEQISQADPRGYRATMRALGKFNAATRLHEVQCPTLVLTSENDTTVPVETQQALARGIPNARQVLFPKGGHALSVDQADAFNTVVLEFLRSNTP